MSVYATNEECNPIFSQCTQEQCENVDVTWDWYSPQSKPCRKPHKNKAQDFPKPLLKKYPSNSQLTSFNKIKTELETLRDEVILESIPNNSLEATNIKKATAFKLSGNMKDIFNDSMDEMLLECSQEIESIHKELLVLPQQLHNVSNKCSEKNLPKSYEKCKIILNPNCNKSSDDYLNCPLGTWNCDFQNLQHSEEIPLYEQDNHKAEDSPIKCSPEEIEKKRLEAKAKLEAKKKQNIIEKNRLVALKRLEEGKKRRTTVKGQTKPQK